MKSILDSKTIRFNLLMAAAQALSGSMTLMEGVLSADTFILVSVALGIVQAVGGVYLRLITSEAIGT